VLKAHDVGYLFYIGGNDSMDTAHKVGAMAKGRGLDLVATGVAKTIDNDVGDSEFKIIDHTPDTVPWRGTGRASSKRRTRRTPAPARPTLCS